MDYRAVKLTFDLKRLRRRRPEAGDQLHYINFAQWALDHRIVSGKRDTLRCTKAGSFGNMEELLNMYKNMA